MPSHEEKPPKEIHFKVDNEPFTTTASELTPDFIIDEYAKRDPKTNYLLQIIGKETISYKDKGGIPIPIDNGDRFQCVAIEPTPVSDPQQKFGVEAFISGLTELAYEPAALDGRPDHITIAYQVQTGRFAGTQVQLGFIVPGDFPNTPPSGPHVSPRIWPINPSAPAHPERAHESESFGPDWQYWSRPVRDWARNRSVAAYMSHIWNLWHTQ